MEQRQLRPVYDALDNEDVKQALKECNKIIRKHPNHLSAQALKAYALARTGASNEVLEIGESILKVPRSVANPHVRQALVRAYKSIRRPAEEIAVYNAALKHLPDDESIHSALFLTTASNEMYAEQHHAAVALNKAFKRQRYTWWIIVSLLLQTQLGKGSDNTQLQLSLAQRMAEKALQDHQIKNTEHLRILLLILEAQNNHEAMLKALSPDSPLAQQIANDPDLVTQRISLFVKTRAFKEAMSSASQTLEIRDNWADYKHYVEAVTEEIGQLADDSDAHQLLRNVCESIEKWSQVRGRARGARLALVELSAKLHCSGYGDRLGSIVSSLGDQIWKYVDTFQNKAICYSDIMQYFVDHVCGSSATQDPSTTISVAFIDFHDNQLSQRIQHARENADNSEDCAQAWVNMEKIRYLLQTLRGDNNPELWTKDVDLFLEFGLDPKKAKLKQAACSDMVLLACQRLIQAAFLAYPKEQQQSHGLLSRSLFIILPILEEGIRLNGENFLLKLYAIRLYLYLSCYSRARALYDTLNIKNIQNDTLGHFIVGQGLALGCYIPDLELSYAGVSFYDRAHFTIPHELESAYKNGTYSNIPDFLEFRNNLKHSFQREITHRCALRSETISQGCSKDVVETLKAADTQSIEPTDSMLASLHDNRDVKVMGLLTPLGITEWNLEILTRPSPLPTENWIRLYSLLPQIMHYIAAADVDMVEAKQRQLLNAVEEAGESLSAYDKTVAHGLHHIASVYICLSQKGDSVDEKIDSLVKIIETNIPEEQTFDQKAAVLDKLPLATIRALAAATEVFTYAVTAKHAASSNRLPGSNSFGFALTQLRKRSLRCVSALRAWANKPARAAICESWIDTEQPMLLSNVSKYMQTKHKQAVDVVVKGCVDSWLKSAKGIDAIYNYALMTVPALLFSADLSWFEPLPTDDIEVDLAQVMPLPEEEEHEVIEDTWGDLNKKRLLR
ncbi:mitochondrial distribution and morphology [Coemansia sp. RSA 986]|nr:mitochondrial distribution and morphology [Coemansia sp. RSA 986]